MAELGCRGLQSPHRVGVEVLVRGVLGAVQLARRRSVPRTHESRRPVAHPPTCRWGRQHRSRATQLRAPAVHLPPRRWWRRWWRTRRHFDQPAHLLSTYLPGGGGGPGSTSTNQRTCCPPTSQAAVVVADPAALRPTSAPAVHLPPRRRWWIRRHFDQPATRTGGVATPTQLRHTVI